LLFFGQTGQPLSSLHVFEFSRLTIPEMPSAVVGLIILIESLILNTIASEKEIKSKRLNNSKNVSYEFRVDIFNF